MKRIRKGVSSVFSNVLLILITVIGMTALFSFSTNFFSDFQSRQGSAVFEGLSLSDTWYHNNTEFTDGNGTNFHSQAIILNYYNYGKIDLKINQVYINGTPARARNGTPGFYILTTQNGEPVDIDNIGKVDFIDFIEIPVGEFGSIILDENLAPDHELSIKIITERNALYEMKIRR
jgi:flagellin-like protein